jgi:type III pantothenate kinase
MDLVIDVGNSETVIGLADGESTEIVGSWRISTPVPRTRDELGLVLRALLHDHGHAAGSVRRGTLCSVVPSMTGPLSEAVEATIGRSPIVVTGEAELPIRLDVDEPKTVGADRIVNTLAAKELYGRNTIAVDLGTATTFDCITSDGVFLGGVIAQGLQAGLDWLGRRTAMLPRVELAPPPTVIGRRTETCIHSGIFYSAVEAVDGIVRRIVEEWGAEDVLVVATGGHAELIGPHCASVERVEPHLTLVGLAIAGRILGD